MAKNDFDTNNVKGKDYCSIFDGYFFAPISADVDNEVEYKQFVFSCSRPIETDSFSFDSMRKSLESYQKLKSKMSDDDVDVDSIVILYNSLLFNLRQLDSGAICEVSDNGEIVRHSPKCWFRAPNHEERDRIINLYVDIEPYRSFIVQTSDYGPYPSEYDFIIRCTLLDIIKMYDEYCADIHDLIVSPAPQSVQALPPRPETTHASEPTENALPTESINTEEGMAIKVTVKPELAINLEDLGSYFTASFRGFGGTENLFSKLVEDTMHLPNNKELGMVAFLLYESNVLNRHKPDTFATWMRIFFTNLGKTPPKDTHKNKYKPNEKIRGLFAYVT